MDKRPADEASGSTAQPGQHETRGVPVDESAEGRYDGLAWQSDLEALIDRLPDPDLAANLQDCAAGKLRKALREGDDPPLQLLSADDILSTQWEEPSWAVDGLLPAGLTILAGKPKAGKSWLALQILQAVAAGGMFLDRAVKDGRALYLALEDPPRRLKDRMQKQRWPTGSLAEFMPIGHFQDQVGDLANGGGERLSRQIQARGYRLVVVDTLSRSMSGDQNQVDEMTQALAPIQEMAHSQNCAVVIVDHHRKSSPFNEDAIADILGSTAKGASCDTAWGLYRETGKVGAKLSIIGRDVVEQNLALRWDPVLFCWQSEGDADDIEMTERREEIIAVLELLGKAQLKDVAREVGRDRSNTFRRLQDLVGAGKVRRLSEDQKVFYTLSGYKE